MWLSQVHSAHEDLQSQISDVLAIDFMALATSEGSQESGLDAGPLTVPWHRFGPLTDGNKGTAIP